MAVPEQTPYIEYDGNGDSKVFPLTFDCEDSDHLIVKVNDEMPVVGAWSLVDEKVVFINAPAIDSKIVIQRNTPTKRSTTYKSYDNSLRPAPVDSDFDTIWRKLQELGVTNWLTDTDIKNLGIYVNSLNDETRDDFFNKLGNLEQNTNAMLEEAIKNGAVSALAITTVETEEELEDLSAWDGRTVAVSGIGNYKYSSTTNTWARDFITDRQVITVDSVADLLSLDKWAGRTVKTKSYNTPNYALKNPFAGNMTYVFDSNRVLENDGGSVINGWVAQFPQYNEVSVDWFGADPNADLTNVDSTIQIEKACKYLSNVLDSGDEGDNEVGKILYSAGAYIQGDIKIRSFIKYEGAGTLATRLQPKAGYSWVFDTEGTSSIQVGVPKPPRLYGANIYSMMIGCGKYEIESPIPEGVGGINLEYSNYIDLSSVYVRYIDGNGLRIKEGMDSVFNDLRLMYCGNARDTSNPVYALDVISGDSDISNALRFYYPHIEHCTAALRFDRTRHCVVNDMKIEGGSVSSKITSNSSLVFNTPELTWSYNNVPMLDIKNGSVGDTAGVVFNIPQCISGSSNTGWYFQVARSGGFTEINAPFARNVNTLVSGSGYSVNGGTGYACGNSLLVLNSYATVRGMTLLAQNASSATDGTDDTIIITGSGCEVSNMYLSSQAGSLTDGGAYINASSATNPVVVNNKFEGTRQYCIRPSVNSYRIRDNEIIGNGVASVLSSSSLKPNYTLVSKDSSGFGVGGVAQKTATIDPNTTATVSSAIAGSSQLMIRGGSGVCCAIVFTDSSVANLALMSQVGSANVIVNSTGAASDGNIYIRKSGANLIIENRTASQILFYISAIHTVS